MRAISHLRFVKLHLKQNPLPMSRRYKQTKPRTDNNTNAVQTTQLQENKGESIVSSIIKPFLSFQEGEKATAAKFSRKNLDTIESASRPEQELSVDKTTTGSSAIITASYVTLNHMLSKIVMHDLLNDGEAVAGLLCQDATTIACFALPKSYNPDLEQLEMNNVATFLFRQVEHKNVKDSENSFVSFVVAWKPKPHTNKVFCYFEDTLVEGRIVSWEFKPEEHLLFNFTKHEAKHQSTLRQVFASTRYGESEVVYLKY